MTLPLTATTAWRIGNNFINFAKRHRHYHHQYQIRANNIISSLTVGTLNRMMNTSSKSNKVVVKMNDNKKESCNVGLLRLMDYIRINDQIQFFNNKNPNFSLPLQLDYDSCITNHELQVHEGTNYRSLSMKYKLSSLQQLQLPLQQQQELEEDRIALSTYFAILDEVTTWALVIADPKQKDNVGRPGVTVTMRNQWDDEYIRTKKMNKKHELEKENSNDEVFISTCVSKIGRQMGFVNATVYDGQSMKPICYASQIKFLPSSSKIIEILLHTPIGFMILKLVANLYESMYSSNNNKNTITTTTNRTINKNKIIDNDDDNDSSSNSHTSETSLLLTEEEKNESNNSSSTIGSSDIDNNNKIWFKDIFHEQSMMQYDDNNYTATFTILPIHNNPIQLLHGGSQSIIMEMVGTYFAKKELLNNKVNNDNSSVSLQSIQIDYLSPLRNSSKKNNTVQLQVQIISKSEESVSMNIELFSCKNLNKVISQGSLSFQII